MAPPFVLMRWTGHSFEPLPRDRSACLDAYETGRCYRMTEYQERSAESHNHEFAEVNEAWKNLPDHLREQFPNPTMLRKHGLIRGGYCNSQQIVCASAAEAMRWAPIIRGLNEYSIVVIKGSVVTVLTAHSQSRRAMGKAQFQASKDSVLAFCAELVGTSPKTLRQEAGRAA